jgi:hypothetical protein
MTRHDVATRLPGVRDYSVDLGHGRSARLFGVPSIPVSGCPAKLVLQFKQRKLSNINLDFQLDDAKFATCDEAIARDLRAAYGKPATWEVEDGRMFRIQRGTWLSPTSEIYFHAISETLSGAKTMLLELSVTYLPRLAAAEGKLSAGD